MDAKATPPIPEDMDELLARARALIRAGSLDDAETLLRAAIDRNPNDRALAQNLRHVQLRRMQAR